MKTENLISRLPVLAAAIFALSPALSNASEAKPNASFDKYRMILNRAPFGRLPQTPTDDELAVALEKAALDQQVAPPPRLSDTISLHAISRFRGIPAAGLLDKLSGKSFFLTEGQTLGDFTLEAVSVKTSSVVLSKGDQMESISMSFASGQPTNLTQNADSSYLSVLDVRKQSSLPAESTLSESNPTDDSAAARTTDVNETPPTFSAEDLAAATTVDASGETRISFRELHRLRVQQSKEKAEQERSQMEARVKAEREQAAAKAREDAEQAELSAKVQAAAEALHRRQVIQAIKEGYDVAVDFELTAKEAKELAAAGFAISSEEITSAETGDATAVPEKEASPTP